MTEAVITYTWAIAQLEVASSEDGLADVVKTIHWTLAATDGDDTASCYGSVGTGAPDPEAFIPYSKLTLEEVIPWLEELLDVDRLHAGLASQIANQKNPPIMTLPLPWA